MVSCFCPCFTQSKIAFAAVLLGFTSASISTSVKAEPNPILEALLVPEMTVIAAPDDYRKLAGSGAYLSSDRLAKFEDTDINAMLEEVAGVYIQEEDGYGLRPNIGMRAAMSARSSKITIMEDGVLIAPAPYASPSAYYFPRAGRMAGIEVVKGPAAIRFGPYTIGGAINLISTPIPQDRQAEVKLRAGSDGATDGQLTYGNNVANWSYIVDVSREHNDGFKSLPNGFETGFDIESYLGKLRYTSAQGNQYIELKYEYTDEVSNETYFGLTDEDFAINAYQRYAGTQSDIMNNEHRQAVLTHQYNFANGAELKTQIYKTWFARNWYKLDRVGTSKFNDIIKSAEKFAVLKGGDSAAACLATPSAANCSTTDLEVKANNREYQAGGIQAKLSFDVGSHALEIGFRNHKDEVTRVQWSDSFYIQDGAMVRYVTGVPGATGGSNNRYEEAKARSFYIYDSIDLGRLILTPGLRHEDIEGIRIARLTGKIENDTAYNETTFGLGATYELSPDLLLIGGVYEGFNAAGVTNNRGETALNMEAGLRYMSETSMVELIGFRTDFDNLIAACTASSGCDNIGDSFDGGAVEVYGLELTAQKQVQIGAVNFPLGLTYTFTDTEFKSSFEASAYELWGNVEAGDELPYVAHHQLGLSVGVVWGKWDVTARAKYKSEQRSTAGNGAIPAGEKIRGFMVTDIAATYDVNEDISLTMNVDNLFDETYEVSRHPYGLRPGLLRSWKLGIRAQF